MTFSTTIASIANLAHELINLSPTLTTSVMIYGGEMYEEYPGNYNKLYEKNIQQELYERRILLWKNSDTDEHKDEVLDNSHSKHSYAVKTIQALLQGKKTRKEVAFQHRKQLHIDEAIKRREQRLLGEQEIQDRLYLLQEENVKLKQALLDAGTSTYNAIVKNNIEEVLHTRQVHYLRTRTKLISEM